MHRDRQEELFARIASNLKAAMLSLDGDAEDIAEVGPLIAMALADVMEADRDNRILVKAVKDALIWTRDDLADDLVEIHRTTKDHLENRCQFLQKTYDATCANPQTNR